MSDNLDDIDKLFINAQINNIADNLPQDTGHDILVKCMIDEGVIGDVLADYAGLYFQLRECIERCLPKIDNPEIAKDMQETLDKTEWKI